MQVESSIKLQPPLHVFWPVRLDSSTEAPCKQVLPEQTRHSAETLHALKMTTTVLHFSAALNSCFRFYSRNLAFYNAKFYKLRLFLLKSLQSSFRQGNQNNRLQWGNQGQSTSWASTCQSLSQKTHTFIHPLGVRSTVLTILRTEMAETYKWGNRTLNTRV